MAIEHASGPSSSLSEKQLATIIYLGRQQEQNMMKESTTNKNKPPFESK